MESQKSYNGAPALYLIPTPIGNMDDITVRAIKTLQEVEVIFSEDTRVTGQLLQHFEIKKKLIANHEHNERENQEKALEYLKNGYSIGLVSDRGTPVISDPGYELSQFIIEKGYHVVALPGPTALIPALIASGISPMPFFFYGFLNSKQSKRIQELEKLKEIESTIILYEAPHRILKTLENIREIMGNRPVSISREISKKFEEIYRGRVEEVEQQLLDARGEMVIILGYEKPTPKRDNLTICQHVDQYVKLGFSINEAIKQVAKEKKIVKSDVYREYHVEKEREIK